MKATRASPKTIDDYISRCTKDVQPKLREIRSTIRSIAPDAIEKISYGIPTFAAGKNLFHFAAFKSHIGLYPGSAAITAFASDLGRYKTSKGAIQIPLDQKLPLQLIAKLVRFNLNALPKKAGKGAGRKRSAATVSATDDLVSRMREALSGTPRLTERRMFGSTGFMVRGNLCLSARAERIMCRIDPVLHDKAVARAGCKTVVMRGRPMKGYVYVAAEVLKTRRALDYWVRLALAYNHAMERSRT